MRKFLKVSLLISFRWSRLARDGRNREMIIQNFDSDIRLIINPSRSMGKIIYWTGFHELKELLFLHNFLKPGMVFVDIGANMGEYTLFAAKRLPGGKVYSFEPLPRMHKLLEANCALNPFSNISLLPYGLSDRSQELTIFDVKDRHEGLATLYPGDRESEASHSIELKSFDEEFGGNRLERLDFIKVDIEGSELPALKGARRSLEKFKPHVMVEINDSTYEKAGYKASDILAFFEALHYSPFVFDKNAALQPCAVLPVFGNVIFKPA